MKRGFTDRLYALNFTFTILLTIACLLITLFSGKLEITDLSPLSSTIEYAFLQLAIHSGFIVWKAKAENIAKHKLEKEEVEEIEDE